MISTTISAQTSSPKRELRGVWVASLGIDWLLLGVQAQMIFKSKEPT